MATKKQQNHRLIGLKAISVNQPFADLIVSGAKDIENRQVRSRHRGRLLIHASQRVWMDEVDGNRRYLKLKKDVKYKPVRGAIIGEVMMIDVVTKHKSRWFEGEYGYMLKNAKRYKKPIPCDGWLGIWPVTAKRLSKK